MRVRGVDGRKEGMNEGKMKRWMMRDNSITKQNKNDIISYSTPVCSMEKR